ncbi:exporter of polyketide antibiotics [Dietzia cercidiphylli]|uniref:Exporter of polyketide antibiotics n=1 Tax=Dietzia cercidiphylli TaxID=498199 RepID=A0ABP4UZI7_9ACTN
MTGSATTGSAMTATPPATRERARTAGSGSPLAGTGTLVRFSLRRDRLKLPAWVGGLGLFVVYIGAALPQLAPTEDDLAAVVPLFTQPVGRMFTGPAYGMDAPTFERFFAAGYAPYLFLLAALMNIMLVTRHTRVEEQTGRAELIRANVTGRHSALTATLIVAAITNALACVVVAGLAIAGGFAPLGSLLIGLGTALAGMAFAGIAAVTAQLSAYSRAAAGMAGLVLGVAFILRALGDMAAVGGTALSWASPLGWAAQTAPYVYDRWWPLLPLVVVAVVGSAAAYVLQSRRDFGASLLAPRPGPAHAGRFLGRPVGLAARLQRGSLLGWGAAVVVLGTVNGAFTDAMLSASGDMPQAMQDMFGAQGLVNGYVAFLGSFVAVLAAAYVVYATQSLRDEEGRGRADLILATPVSRISWVGAHLAVVACGAVLILAVTGICTALAAAVVTGDTSLVGGVIGSHLGATPAVLLVLGVCAVLYGWAPRLTAPVGWALVALMFLVANFADLLDFPGWLRSLSPLHHLAAVPVEEFAPSPFLLVAVMAGALVAAGLAGFRRRQVVSG